MAVNNDEAPVYKINTIYVTSDKQYFVSPDGIGRYWYGSLTEAMECTEADGDDIPIRRATKHEEEWY